MVRKTDKHYDTNLAKRRLSMGYTREGLARILAKGKESKVERYKRLIFMYESKERDINAARAKSLYPIAKALECNIEDLMELDNLEEEL